MDAKEAASDLTSAYAGVAWEYDGVAMDQADADADERLRKVQAAAWDQGARSGYSANPNEWVNPYKELA